MTRYRAHALPSGGHSDLVELPLQFFLHLAHPRRHKKSDGVFSFFFIWLTMASPSKKQCCKTQTLAAFIPENTFVWEKIVRFLAASEQIPQDGDGTTLGPGAAGQVLRTVSNLRLVSRGLATYFRPDNQAFWRDMVLLCFDFTVLESDMNVEIVEDTYDEITLQEPVRLWRALDVRFRPSQYQFLTDIQSGRRAVTSWPENEDAYSLFVDLQLVSWGFRQFKGLLETRSDGEEFVDPVLLSAIPIDVDRDPEELQRTEDEDEWDMDPEDEDERWISYDPLFAHCGFLVETWKRSSEPLTRKWIGFLAQDSAHGVAEAVYSQEDECYKGWEEQDEYEFVFLTDFPHGVRCIVELLQDLVQTRFSDWRQVTPCCEEDGAPVFYVGKSTLSERWLGFVGHCQYRF